MATQTGKYVPSGTAKSLDVLKTAFEGETGITSATIVPSATQVGVLRNHLIVVSTDAVPATALTNLTNAATAVGAELLPGDETIVEA